MADSSDGGEPVTTTRRTILDQEWVRPLLGVGWVAKGIVYTLMGIAALNVAAQNPTSNEASPEGAIGRVAANGGGRVLVGLLAVGLALYCAWRILSVIFLRGSDLHTWAERLGFSFSAAFYATLAFSAANAAARNTQPGRSNTVESLSRRVLEWPAGRIVLALAGLVTIGVGVYFLVRRVFARSFIDDLHEIEGDDTDDGFEQGVVIAGVVGWLGRSIVTTIVGGFVLWASWTFDPDDATGFDRSLRRLAVTTEGSVLVGACAVGLIAYGLFCMLSVRRRTLSN